MPPFVRAVAVAAAIVSLAGVAGCGKVAEKVAEKATENAIESQGGSGADVDFGADGELDIRTEDGSFSSSAGEVPAGWPDDVPFPDGLSILSGSDVEDGTTTLSSVVATSEEDPEDLLAFYEDALDGWETTNRIASEQGGGTFRSESFVLGNRLVQLTAGREPGAPTNLSVAHSVSATE